MAQMQEIYQRLLPQQAAMTAALATFAGCESGSHDLEGVNRADDLATHAFEQLGFRVERMAAPGSGDHRLAWRSGSGKGRLLALIHLDTVWPRGTLSENPFRIEDGRAYGPGVLDMKGGWVVLLWALQVLKELGWDGLSQTAVFMTADEELGSPSARALIEREAQAADWALVMEPARESGAVVVERAMTGALLLEIEGMTAHTQYGDRGANAIEELAHKTLALHALIDRPRGVLVNVGTVSGGSARQVIADLATASIDVRAPDAASAGTLLEQIRAIVARQYVRGTRSTLSGGITRPAFGPNDGARRLLQIVQRCGRELGMTIEGAATRAGSDGNFTGALGVPTLDGLGPEGANACSRGEFVLLESLPRRAALLAALISNLSEA